MPAMRTSLQAATRGRGPGYQPMQERLAGGIPHRLPSAAARSHGKTWQQHRGLVPCSLQAHHQTVHIQPESKNWSITSGSKKEERTKVTCAPPQPPKPPAGSPAAACAAVAARCALWRPQRQPAKGSRYTQQQGQLGETRGCVAGLAGHSMAALLYSEAGNAAGTANAAVPPLIGWKSNPNPN